MSYIIGSNRPWCNGISKRLNEEFKETFHLIKTEKELNIQTIQVIKPKIIFLPFWSYLIPETIFKEYNCIIFHMTDLPYGRGGSPLQNLIIKGNKDTMISAVKCIKEIDAGPVYLKKPMSLSGTAEEIYLRTGKIIENMIVEILRTKVKPEPQVGDIVQFLRRKPKDGNWTNVKSLDEVYDYIRMLDADGYPHAFIYNGKYKLEFKRPVRSEESVLADVKITMYDESGLH